MNLKKRWLGKYSISFLCTCALVYFLQIFYGKSLVYMAGGETDWFNTSISSPIMGNG